MTLTKTFKAFALTAAFAFAAATAQAADPAKTELTVSTSQGPYSDLFLKGVKPILEKEGYTIK